MSNMSYCRFHNTYHDLVDCKNALYNEDISSDEEKGYAKRLIELCREISENYEPEFVDEISNDNEE